MSISAQMVFDAGWKAFIVGDAPPSMNDVGKCAYLNNRGDKCIVGLCIPDNHPVQSSNLSVYALSFDYPELFSHEDILLLETMQEVLHDNLTSKDGGWIHSKEDRKIIYRQFAEEYGLSIPEN